MILVRTGFEMNKKYIAEKLCENRTRPWMQCKGRCVLVKKIREAEEKEAKEMYKAPQYEAVLVISSSLNTPHITDQVQDHPLNDFILVSSYLNEIFHPPSAII